MGWEPIFKLFSSPKTAWAVLSCGSFFIGLILLLWSIGGELKLKYLHLPPLRNKLSRGVVFLFALLFAFPGSYGIWYFILRPAPTLTIFTGLASEELEFLNEEIKQFENEQGVIVRIENVHRSEMLDRLENNKGNVDLITIDINSARHELVSKGLIEELPEKKYKGLMPSSVNPVLLKHLKINDKRYFIPFRPNVQIVFWNKKIFGESKNLPMTWAKVKEVAKKLYEKDAEARVVINLADDDIHITLFQLIRSAGGDPFDFLDQQSKEALKFLRTLYPYVSKSPQVNWQTASGFLLTDSVYLVRNWTFSLNLIHHAGRDDDFGVYSGWRWEEDTKPFNLLGGEFLALPKNAPHKKLAVELIRFLISREVQTRLVKKLVWPPMRLDTMRENIEGQKQKYIKHMKTVMETINKALQYAEPLPDDWFPHMPCIYKETFDEIVKETNKDKDIESILSETQEKIHDKCRRLTKKSCS